MLLKTSICFFFFIISLFASENNKIISKIEGCSSVIVTKDSVTFISKKDYSFAKKKTGTPDYTPTNYKIQQTCKVGETFRVSSIGYNLYWEIININQGIAKINYFGFIRGIGSVTEIKFIKTYNVKKF